MSDIDNYKDALDKINDRRLKYLPGNPKGFTCSDFLLMEYKSVYDNNYVKHLRGGPFLISKMIVTQMDIDYYNILFKGYSRANLII